MQTIPFNELRAHLAQVLDVVEAGDEPVVISRRGKAAAVLVSCAQYERLGKPGFDLTLAIDAWRTLHGPDAQDSGDDPWAGIRDHGLSGGRVPVDFAAE